MKKHTCWLKDGNSGGSYVGGVISGTANCYSCPDGFSGITCNECKDNVVGDNCEECAAGYSGYPDCTGISMTFWAFPKPLF